MEKMQPSEIITKYLTSLLSPEQKEELNQLLGKNNTVTARDPDDDDLAADALRGRISMDRLPPRIKRQAMARIAPDRASSASSFAERYPEASHIRRL